MDRFLRVCSVVVICLAASVAVAVWLAEWDYHHRKHAQAVAKREFEQKAGRSVQLVQTSRDGGDRLSAKEDVPIVPDFDFEGPSVLISATYDQEITGFGAPFTEAAAAAFGRLGSRDQQYLADLFWGRNGIGYTMGEVRIPEGEVSRAIPADSVSDDLGKTSGKVMPLVNVAVQELRKLRTRLELLVAAGDAPAWMVEGEECPVAWAYYLSKWVRNTEMRGGPLIWAVVMRPDPALLEGHCIATPQSQARFMYELAPLLEFYDKNVKVFGSAHYAGDAYRWAEAVYSSKTTSSAAAGLTFESYAGNSFEGIRKVHRDFPTAQLYAKKESEAYRANPLVRRPRGAWEIGEGHAHDIIADLNMGAVGWMDSDLFVDAGLGAYRMAEAAAVLNGTSITLNPLYYLVGHFARYVLPKSLRIQVVVSGSHHHSRDALGFGTCGAVDGLQAAAFLRPDDVIAAVVLNCADHAVNFKILEGVRAVNATIPPHAMQTYLLGKPPVDRGVVV